MALILQQVRDVQSGTVYRAWSTINSNNDKMYAGYDGSDYWVTQIKFTTTTAISTISLSLYADSENTSSSYQLRWGISSSETQQMNNRGNSAVGTVCGSIRFSNGTYSQHTFTSGVLNLPAGTYYISIWNGTAGYGDFCKLLSYTSYPMSMAQTNATTYTVSYNANGGSGAPSSQIKFSGVALTLSSTKPTRSSTTDSCTVTYDANGGACLTASATSSRTTSYTFKNWNTNSGGTGTSYSSGGSYTANAAVTLYAQWTTSIGAYDVVTLPTPTRDGYVFLGWATSTSSLSGGTGSYTPVGDVTLYAIWAETEPVDPIGVAYVDNASSYGPCLVAIDDGASFKLCAIYVDTGTDWVACG